MTEWSPTTGPQKRRKGLVWLMAAIIIAQGAGIGLLVAQGDHYRTRLRRAEGAVTELRAALESSRAEAHELLQFKANTLSEQTPNLASSYATGAPPVPSTATSRAASTTDRSVTASRADEEAAIQRALVTARRQEALQQVGTGRLAEGQPDATRAPGRPSAMLKNAAVRPHVGGEGGHWIKSVGDDGRIVVLEDESVWEIAGPDRADTALWLATDDITIIDDGTGRYDCKLVHVEDGETAEARLLHR